MEKTWSAEKNRTINNMWVKKKKLGGGGGGGEKKKQKKKGGWEGSTQNRKKPHDVLKRT